MKTFITCLALICQVGYLSADTLFDSFGPGNAYQNSFAAVGLTPQFTNNPFEQARSFVIPSETDYLLDQITVAAGFFIGDLGGPNAMTFSLMQDNAGQPGFLMESLMFTELPSAWEGGGVITAISTERSLLHAGQTYWFAASSPDSSTGWFLAPEGTVTGKSWRHVQGVWTASPSSTSPALRVSATPVPEPTPVILLGLGLLAFLVRPAFVRALGRRA